MGKVFKVSLAIVCGMGLLFFALGAGFGLYNSHVKAECTAVEGVIVDTHNPDIGYTWGDRQLFYKGAVSSVGQRAGDAYTLYVNPETGEVRADTVFEILSWAFGGIGAAMLLAGFIMYLCGSGAARKREELLSYGRRVTATVDAVRQNVMLSVNNRHPWVVTASCVHPLTNEKLVVRSQSLWSEPTVQSGGRVDVLFDPVNEKRYAMDIFDQA